MAEGKQRKEVYYSGHVQGVGFRYTTRQIAKQFDVTGFVRNLPDGQVHLVVEGQSAEIRQFLTEIATTFTGRVTNTRADSGVSSDEFSGFEIHF
ncbi:MAG: acylphosphatase [Pirellulaceae bacterium]|nr:acylphosphatase [Pirellulaceae bacterium]HJN13574.1 acylphosphatase [Pirellulaceae bacterium]